MKKLYLLLLMSCTCLLAFAQPSTFTYNGLVQNYTVPSGIYSVAVDMIGGAGGKITGGGTGGNGGRVQCNLAVTPGQILYVYLGQKGVNGNASFGGTVAGGINSGGGADGGAGSSYDGGGGGGGSTDIRTIPYTAGAAASLSSRIVVAGGGGGGGYVCGGTGDNGGGGGGLTGGTGVVCSSYNSGEEGTPGTQTTPGAAGAYAGYFGSYGGSPGLFGVGGAAYSFGDGGGGGGGWYGGGGAYEGGACGGSSYTAPGITSAVTHTQGLAAATANGKALITPLCNATGAILGSTPTCIGNTMTLTNPTGIVQGTWSSSNTGIATIDSTIGIVKGVSAGTAVITYNVPNGCSAQATAVVTINPNPAAFGGTFSVCTGLVTTLTESVTGGTWSSITPSLATVDVSGNVTGARIGVDTIYYTLPTGCALAHPVTVNGSPGPIIGNGSLCQGASTPLTDGILGGAWISGNTSVATVDVFGNLSAVGTGSALVTVPVTYLLSNGCSAIRTFSINPLPTQSLVSGTNSFCAGGSSTTPISLLGSTVGINYQLVNGTSNVGAPLNGNGGLLSFGIQSAPGTYTVVATNPVTGCVSNMLASAIVSVKPLPASYTVTGGGTFCQYSGLGAPIGLSGSSTGVNYQLYKDGSPLPAATLPGTGSALNFGYQSVSGDYTIVASTTGTPPSCTATMLGDATINVNPQPAANNVIGGGAYCAGGPGIDIGLDASNSGVSYQLYKDGTPVGTPVLGTDGPLYFGLQTAVSADYTVVGTNIITTCTNNMTGIASVSIAPPLTIYNVTGGGTGCEGSAFAIGLDGSDLGVDYQVYRGATPVGSAVEGLPGAFDITTLSAAGTYHVVATSESLHCVSNMTGTVTITETPIPVVYNLSAGGGYCTGGAGIPLSLSGSQVGVNYSLYHNSVFVDSVSGTGSSLNLGTFTAAGTYTVVADNPHTLCTSNMSGVAVVSVNPPPAIFNVTGGGSYCVGGGGVNIGLDLSSAGVNYQLFEGSLPVGSVIPGTGDALSFGSFTSVGAYTVVATNAVTTCVANMAGSAIVSVNALPAAYTVSGGGSFCAGDAGRTVSIAGSNTGITYQLYSGATTIGGPVAGTGSAINFGLQTLAGSYTVVATNITTSCSANMPGSATVVVNPIPAAFSVTGGGAFCAGSAGRHIGLGSSNSGVNYTLYNAGGAITTIPGSGFAVDFGVENAAGTYTVIGVSAATGCTNTMNDSAVIVPKLPPVVYTVLGGGSYCSGSSTMPSVGLTGSTENILYQLYKGGIASGTPLAGTGSAIDFGPQANAGIYTIVATDTTAGCTSTMAGATTIIINLSPAVNTVTGGGSYCAGGAGVHIFLSNSSAGIQYELSNSSGVVSTVIGTGGAVDFGIQSAVGSYTAVANNTATGCTSNMAGNATVSVNPLPVSFNVTAANSGSYCASAAGVSVSIDGSETGVHYQLFDGSAPSGLAIAGTGSALDLGTHTAGTYTVVATNVATGCNSHMSGSAIVNAVPLPNTYTVSGGGNYCSTGLGLHIGLSGSDAGTMYQLYRGSTAVGAPVTGTSGSIDFGLYNTAGSYSVVATNGGTTACTNNMTGAAVISVYPLLVPSVSITTTDGAIACLGNIAHFAASVTNGGSSPSYEWMVNGAVVGSGATYSYLPTDGDVVTALVHSNAICAIPDTASSALTVNVTLPQLPSLSVMVTPGDIICEGSPVAFTATSAFGGSAPIYTWIKNGAYVSTGLTYSYTPNNNDVVMLRMVSNYPCRLADTVYSASNTLVVDPPVIPVISIYANPGDNISAGQTVVFTANIDNGVPAPAYQWLINGVAIAGATNSTFTTSTLNDNDSVTCEVMGGCDLKGFNSIHMHVASEGVQQVATTGSNVILVPNPNKGLFTIKGSVAGEEATIEITNMLGQVVYTGRVATQNGSINEKIQLRNSLANGMYLLNLRSGAQSNIFHFTIQQ